MNQPPPHNYQPQKKSGINKVGMFFIILGVIIFALIVGGGFMVVNTIKDIGNMLEPTSRVTTYVPTAADKLALEKKLAALEKIQQEGGEYKLIVTPSDINTYISDKEHSEAGSTQPRFRVDIQGEVLSGMISVPIKDDETGKVSYFNGEAKFTASLSNGELDLRLKDVLVKGKKPPFLINMVIDQFKKINLAEEINNNPKHENVKKQLLHCKQLEIKDGKASVTLQFSKPTDEKPEKLKTP